MSGVAMQPVKRRCRHPECAPNRPDLQRQQRLRPQPEPLQPSHRAQKQRHALCVPVPFGMVDNAANHLVGVTRVNTQGSLRLSTVSSNFERRAPSFTEGHRISDRSYSFLRSMPSAGCSQSITCFSQPISALHLQAHRTGRAFNDPHGLLRLYLRSDPSF